MELFDRLLNYGVRVDDTFGIHKSLLHLCSKIPGQNLAAAVFVARLLEFGPEIDTRDQNGITLWMDAVLGRKWDLADVLMTKGSSLFASYKDAFNIFGLCINTMNLGSIKYLPKYLGEREREISHREFFLVDKEKQISAVQLASSLPVCLGIYFSDLTAFYTMPLRSTSPHLLATPMLSKAWLSKELIECVRTVLQL